MSVSEEAASGMSVADCVALLRSGAFEVPPDADTSDAGRTIIHSRLGGIGADWDLDDAIALAERSTWRGWMDSLLGHNLGIETYDGDRVRLYAFDVPKPAAPVDEIARLRGIVEQLRELGVSDVALAPVDEWITEKEHAR